MYIKGAAMYNKPVFTDNELSQMYSKGVVLEHRSILLDDEPIILKHKPRRLDNETSQKYDKGVLSDDKTSLLDKKPRRMYDKPERRNDKTRRMYDKAERRNDKPRRMYDKAERLSDKPKRMYNKAEPRSVKVRWSNDKQGHKYVIQACIYNKTIVRDSSNDESFVFQRPTSEVEQISNTQLRATKISIELRKMLLTDILTTLKFENDLIIDNNIGKEMSYLAVVEENIKTSLLNTLNVKAFKFDHKRMLITMLRKVTTESTMNSHGSTDDGVGKLSVKKVNVVHKELLFFLSQGTSTGALVKSCIATNGESLLLTKARTLVTIERNEKRSYNIDDERKSNKTRSANRKQTTWKSTRNKNAEERTTTTVANNVDNDKRIRANKTSNERRYRATPMMVIISNNNTIDKRCRKRYERSKSVARQQRTTMKGGQRYIIRVNPAPC